MIIVDGHQDLAWNMRTFGRDYTLPASETRRREARTDVPALNGDTLLGWPEYQRGRVALIFSTLFASPEAARLGDWETQVYSDDDQAKRVYGGQLDAYHRLVDDHPDKFRLVLSRRDLGEALEKWGQNPDPLEPAGETMQEGNPVGLVPLMEGAEAVVEMEELEEWWQRGLRLIGPAWTGTRFCGGTRQPGPLTAAGFALLETMAEIGFALDISHMDEQAVLQALDTYPGTIVASHSNIHALLKGLESNRFLSDRVVQGLIERGGVIGVVPLNQFLVPGWRMPDGRHLVTLDHIVAHIDYICQAAGSARHAAIGTDFDGGYGLQSVPAVFDTIADLRLLIPRLSERGYSQADIEAIMGQNWIECLRTFLPEE